MSIPKLDPAYRKRDYLLPPGCKDLIDVLNLKKAQMAAWEKSIFMASATQPVERPKSPLEGRTVELPPQIVVADLARLLGIKPFMLLADLMELRLMVDSHETVSFEVAAKVLKKYGAVAKKAS